jgi:hypothetical protein
MEPIELLKAKIPNFPGYAEDDARRLTDALVRSYLGEALAELRERAGSLDAPTADRLETLIFRIEFTNQRSLRAYEEGLRVHPGSPEMPANDAAIVEFGDRVRATEPAEVPALLDDIVSALDRRDSAMAH